MKFALRMSLRELRASWRRLVLFFLCIALGVGGIVHGADAATKQASRILRKSEQDKKAANAQTIKKNLDKIQEILPGKKK